MPSSGARVIADYRDRRDMENVIVGPLENFASMSRFGDTFAVDLLCAWAGVYDVARMLGDREVKIQYDAAARW